MHRQKQVKVMQADGRSKRANSFHQFLKKMKSRWERHKVKQNPEAPPTYNRYRGYET